MSPLQALQTRERDAQLLSALSSCLTPLADAPADLMVAYTADRGWHWANSPPDEAGCLRLDRARQLVTAGCVALRVVRASSMSVVDSDSLGRSGVVVGPLTPREVAVLRQSASSEPTSAVARALGLSTSEVAAVLIGVRRKVGVSSTAEAARRAFG